MIKGFGKILLLMGTLLFAIGACTADPGVDGDGDSQMDPMEISSSDDQLPDDSEDLSSTDPGMDTGVHVGGESCDDPFVLEPYVPWVAHGAHMQDEFNDDHNWNEVESCTTDTDICPSGFANPCRGFNSEVVFQADLKQGQTLKLKTESRASVLYRVLDSCAPEEGHCLNTAWGSTYRPVRDFKAPADGTYYGVIELREPKEAIKIGEWLGNDILINTPTFLNYYLEAGIYDDTEHDCADGLDNNGNGLVDCVDPACFESCGVELHMEETFDVDLVALGETFEPPSDQPPYSIDLPSSFEATFGGVQGAEVIGWHVCGSSGKYRYKVAPYCIQPGFTDDNNTRSGSAGGYLLMADNTEVALGDGAYLTTAPIPLNGHPNVVLTFAQATPTSNHPVYVQVQVSVDDGLSWQVVRQFDRYSRLRRASIKGYHVVDLSEVAGTASSLQVRFFYTDGGMTSGSEGSYARSWQLDDIRVFSGTIDVVPGLLGDEFFEKPVDPQYEAGNDGCDGTDPACQSLVGHDFGDCGEELGWFFNGRICEKAIGCAGHGYCLFTTAGDCARGCSAAGECNMDAFMGPKWPERGVEVQIMGEGSFTIAGTADNWDALADMWPDEDAVYPMPFDVPSCAANYFPEVLRCAKWPPLLASEMSWDQAWEILCSYSLIDDMVFIDFDPPFRGTPR